MKKNILAENMLRFNAKNLSEKTKKEILRLVEQDQMVLNGVISSNSIPGVTSGAPTSLTSDNPNVKVITIGTDTNIPAPAEITLHAVYNDKNSAICMFGGYTLIIGKIGVLDTKTGTLKPNPAAGLFEVSKRIKLLPIGSATLRDLAGLANLFARICKAATNNNYTQAALLYKNENSKLKEVYKLSEYNSRLSLPTDQKAILAFDQLVDKFMR